ncbi:DUF4376 domain-containing protein [Ruegeria sp.]|uniref:DUF4376 domain-containing protein n=1 Tax=Ruegeria sp. TaxID=1879320 RepID=UPI003B0008E6
MTQSPVTQDPTAQDPAPQTLSYDAFAQALLALTETGLALPHDILPWTAFPEEAEPPETITKTMWDRYTWNPPQFAAATQPDPYGREDAKAGDKPAWDSLTRHAVHQACEEARQHKHAQLAAELARRTTFTHNARTWQGDTKSAAAITAAALRAAAEPNWPKDFVWIDAANTRVPMRAEDITALAKALSAWQSARRIHARTLKDAITAATTAEAILAINVAQGWPEHATQPQ